MHTICGMGRVLGHNSAAHSTAHRPPPQLLRPIQRETGRSLHPVVLQDEQQSEQLPKQLPVRLSEQRTVQRRIQVEVEVKVEVEMERRTQLSMQANTLRAMLPPILPDVLRRILRETQPNAARSPKHTRQGLQHRGADWAAGRLAAHRSQLTAGRRGDIRTVAVEPRPRKGVDGSRVTWAAIKRLDVGRTAGRILQHGTQVHHL